MIAKHQLDAPEELEREGFSSASEYDRSDLVGLYPEPPVDDRPLLMSDEERHQLQDLKLQTQIAAIRSSFIWIGFQLVLPVILIAFTVAGYFALAEDPRIQVMLVPALLIVSLIIVGVWIAAYTAILKRFSLHGLSGGAYITTTLLVLALFGVPIYSLASFTQSYWLTVTGLAAGLTLVSIITTFLTLQFATRRTSRRD